MAWGAGGHGIARQGQKQFLSVTRDDREPGDRNHYRLPRRKPMIWYPRREASRSRLPCRAQHEKTISSHQMYSCRTSRKWNLPLGSHKTYNSLPNFYLPQGLPQKSRSPFNVEVKITFLARPGDHRTPPPN